MGGIPRGLRRIALLCLAAVPAFAAQVVDPAAARRATLEAVVVALDADLSSLAAAGHATELALRVQRISTDRALEPVAREWLLDRGLHDLARLAPTREARAVVQQLALRRPEVFTRADPDHGERVTPFYDTGATARFVLRAWERATARAQAEADLATGRTGVIERFAARADTAGSDALREGIIEAVEAAPLAQLAVQRAAVAGAMSAGRRADELALVLARRLADAELATLLIGHADARVALDAIRALPAAFDTQTALGLLADASRRAEIASAATLAIGALAAQDGAARSFLYGKVDDAELGPSAAAALASIGDPAVAAEIGRRLRTTSLESSRRLFVLALKLDGGTAAREELRQFAATRQGSAQLRAEVQQWLER